MGTLLGGRGACPGPGTAGVWVALTASWHSSQAGCAEWPPSSACQRVSQQARFQNPGSAAPAARTPAPTASVSPGGALVGAAAVLGAPLPTGSHSGLGLGLDECPMTLQRGGQPRCGPAPLQAQEPVLPPALRPSPVQTF